MSLTQHFQNHLFFAITQNVLEISEKYSKYFYGPGQVEWQCKKPL